MAKPINDKDIYQRAIDIEKEIKALNDYLWGRKKESGRLKNKIVQELDALGVDQIRKYGVKFTVFDNDKKRLVKIDMPQEKTKDDTTNSDR